MRGVATIVAVPAVVFDEHAAVLQLQASASEVVEEVSKNAEFHKDSDIPKLFINADASGGSLEAEIVDPFDRVLPGYSRENCVPLVANETTHKVKWKNQVEENNRGYMSGLEEKMASQAPGGLKVKLYMDNAILFAVY